MPTQPMTTMMGKLPTTDFSGMNNKASILEKLLESKENYREAIAHRKELCHKFLLNNNSVETTLR
jgi:hypothetical protein